MYLFKLIRKFGLMDVCYSIAQKGCTDLDEILRRDKLSLEYKGNFLYRENVQFPWDRLIFVFHRARDRLDFLPSGSSLGVRE